MKKIILIIAALLIISGSSVIWFYPKERLIEFLSKSARINAKMLVVEGWLPDYTVNIVLEEIKNNSYDHIITTGIKSSDLDYCLIGMNGYLIFYPKLPLVAKEVNDYHTIEVVAKSEMGGIYGCHFNFFINDVKAVGYTADNVPRKYGVTWYGSLSNLDSVMINFDNDMVDRNGDRNFYVREIIIDKKIIIPYQFNSVYDIGSLDNNDRIVNDYGSVAEFARNWLIQNGIDSSKVISMPAKRTRFNKTLSSVVAFRDWLESSGLKTSEINIITLGIHSRRTWLTYRSILNKHYKIGIITIPFSLIPDSEKPDLGAIYMEILRLIYYWIILIPYNFS